MASGVLAGLGDLAAPGLGSAFAVINLIRKQYVALKEGKALCVRLTERAENFLNKLESISLGTVEVEQLSTQLTSLLVDLLKVVTTFANLDVVRRVFKVKKFEEQVKMHNERLDHLFRILILENTDELSKYMAWRDQFEKDAANMIDKLVTAAVRREVWLAFNSMERSGVTKEDITNLVLVAKREVSDESHSDYTLQPLDPALKIIVDVGEEYFVGKKIESPPNWLIAGDEIETIGDPIDKEGLTSIFIGEWQGVRVAVKKFNAICNDNPVFNKHFQVWHSLHHPHIAQLYGAGSSKRAPFFVYEYADHQSLDRCWESLTDSDILRVLHQAALGIMYLHSKHVVHGNLSSSQLLVTRLKDVKIFGFGASYVRKNNKSNSMKVQAREAFLAPECIGITEDGFFRGDLHSPRFESDVYSFGLTILQAMTKTNPFVGFSSEEIREMKQTSAFKQPTDVSATVWSLVTQMCVCDPKKRLSLASVAEELKRLQVTPSVALSG